jgi:hypothetical protein
MTKRIAKEDLSFMCCTFGTQMSALEVTQLLISKLGGIVRIKATTKKRGDEYRIL